MQLIGETEEVWFGRYESISFGLFAWAQLKRPPSGQGTLVAPQAHGLGFVP